MKKLTAVVGDMSAGRTGGEQYDARLLAAATQTGIQVTSIVWQDTWLDKLMGLAVLWRFRHITRSLMLTWQLWRSSGDVLIDVWFAPYVQFWASQTSRRLVLMVHHLRGDLEQDKRVQQAEKVLVQAASEILTVSESSQQQILALRSSHVPITMIPPGFSRPKSCVKRHVRQKKVQLLFVGHITKAKGILDLLLAVAGLDSQGWDLHVVGSAHAEPETWHQAQAYIVEHGLGEQVHMHGRVDDDALQQLYQQADVFVLPSYWEGYGIVFLEAMSFGLPVIATTAGAIPEVVRHGESGLLIEAGDKQALRQVLDTVLGDMALRERLGEQAQKAADVVPDWSQITQQFLVYWQARMHDVR